MGNCCGGTGGGRGRVMLQVKLDLAKEQVLRRTPKGFAVKPTRAGRGGDRRQATRPTKAGNSPIL